VANSVDEGILEFVLDHQPSWVASIAEVVTRGGDTFIVFVAAIVATVFLWSPSRTKMTVFTPIFAVWLSVVSSAFFKDLFDRPRPGSAASVLSVTTSSFPSGHATHSAALAFSLLVCLWPLEKRWASILIVGAVVVGFTRVSLGVHWPSDVMGGWLLAAVCVAVPVLVNRGISARTSVEQ
jgi:undecaprenyl-diphosphatase